MNKNINLVDENSKASIAERFYSIRHALNLSQNELAKLLNVTKQQVASIEQSKRNPGVKLMMRLIDICAKNGIKVEAKFIRPDYFIND